LLHTLWETLRRPVPPFRRGYLAFGWLILLLLVVQAFTGMLLALYYLPSPEQAPESVEYIMRDVKWGWLVRGIHHWSADVMIVASLVQLVKVFLAGHYRGERASSWYIGLLLLVLLYVFAFTGDLLTWDNDGYWAAISALETVETIPIVGPGLALTLRGGPGVGAATLSRTYAGHILLLPWLTFLLLSLHLWLLTRRWRREEGTLT